MAMPPNRFTQHPQARHIGIALIAIALLTLPFALAAVGTTWVRVTNLAILFALLALGLNIVVGFAGLLDLGYIAFYGVGAYVYALLASPQFNLHLPFWAIVPIGALVACMFGILLGAPTLKLRGDYLAIVTLAFGEIIRLVLLTWQNLTGGPNGIAWTSWWIRDAAGERRCWPSGRNSGNGIRRLAWFAINFRSASGTFSRNARRASHERPLKARGAKHRACPRDSD